MNVTTLRLSASAAAQLALLAAPALAQREVTPEQRIERLEKQLQQVQRQVFPRGAPAATAGFADEPAATQTSVRSLDDRLGALERQVTDMVRQSEENGHRVAEMTTELARLRTDQERRLAALESAALASQPMAAVPPGAPTTLPPPATKPKPAQLVAAKPSGAPPVAVPADDAAELAYDEGFQLWRSGKYDEAINSLRAFTSAYPKHRRVSWANNLAGRALLDKGEPRAAAEALLANYRNNPKGERAADSLFYLGQALMKLNQPGQACKAYSELEDVYAASMRAELKRLLPAAKTDARCG